MHTHTAKEEEGFALADRCHSKLKLDELRLQESEVLNTSGEGLMPGLIRAYRAPKIPPAQPSHL